MSKPISLEIRNKVIWDYQNTELTLNVIAKNNKISPFSVKKIIKELPKRGFQGGRIPINENYFKIIDTPFKATVLGMIAADGCIQYHDKDDTKNLRLQLGLEIHDSYYLQYILNDMKSEHKIVKCKERYIKQNGEYSKLVKFDICRPKMCYDLISLGIGTDKSSRLRIPNIEEFKSKFILGYFDGNGSWTFDKNQISFCLYGPVKSFITECKNYIANILNLNSEISIYDVNGNGNCWGLKYKGNEQCFEIFKWIYKDKELFLKRKYEKAQNHFKETGKRK